jgi:RNA polymerase sigma-70 factor, ECF subfamily
MNIHVTGLPANFVPAHTARSVNATRGPSDHALIQRIASGNKLALQALHARYNLRLYRFAFRLLGNAAAAEDVVSELFFDVWRTADKFEDRSQVSTWLLAIARNKAHTMLRQRSAEPLDDEVVSRVADAADDPEAAAQRKQTSAIMRTCLAQLSPAHREIIDLVYYHEKKIREVAVIVGASENTVKTRMFYARKQLAELLSAKGITRH